MPDIRLTSLVPRSTGIARRINAAIDAFFVPDCPICHKGDAQTDGLCADCWRDLTLLDGRGCFHCSRPIPGSETADPDWICAECHHAPPAWQRGRAVFAYNGAGRRLVLSLKHGDRQDTTPLFARWAIAAASDLIADADLAVPIPLHWMRRLKRRSN
ncbi:MAG: double zinc ribbon domain-containing protein, partial [Pseudomonadota bacterium]